jgi:nitrogen regulatory protein PII-like uncharacterized protein
MKSYTILILSQLFLLNASFSQGFDPAEMVAREKENLYKSITDLSEDQVMLIDGVYEEYLLTFTELRDEIMKTRDWQSFRPKIMALRKEKDELMFDILNEDQYQLYADQMETNRKNRQNQQNRRPPGS